MVPGFRILQSARRLPLRELLRAAEALIALTAATLAIGLLPFRLVVRTIGHPRRRPPDERASASAGTSVRSAVVRVSRHLPWKAACFHQSLAAHWMLRRRRIASLVHYGVKQTESDLSAHVWVSVGGTVLIGEEEAASHRGVAVFPADGASEWQSKS